MFEDAAGDRSEDAAGGERHAATNRHHETGGALSPVGTRRSDDALGPDGANDLRLSADHRDDTAHRAAADGPLDAALQAEVARLAPGSLHLTRGLAGLLAALWSGTLRFDAADPRWPDRDRFVVSDGELAPFHRALLSLTGLGDAATLDAQSCTLPGQHPAIEAASGLPGQGFAAGVGLALGERLMAARFGRSLVDHRTWVLASASELGAGLGQEAASLAGELGLDRLAVIFAEPPLPEGEREDRDEIELLRRFAACGWTVRRVDGEDPDAVATCLAAVERARKPTLIAVTPSAPLAAEPSSDARLAWRARGDAGAPRRRGWLKRLARHPRRAEYEEALGEDISRAWERLLGERRRAVVGRRAATLETTIASLAALATADATAGRRLLHLSSTRASGVFAHQAPVIRGTYDGRHLDCGGREHGMAMLGVGLALHGGTMPVAASPTIAADRIRTALRLAAITGTHLVQLLTEDGLSAQADSPLMQPLEHAASLRAIPGLHVFRPGCAVEAVECLELALRRTDGPSAILLSADIQPAFRDRAGPNETARGAYLLADVQTGTRDATLIASGTELAIAVEARGLLAQRGIDVAVVSLPCWELFARQGEEYRIRILGTAPRFGIEAACGFGWERWLGEGGRFIGLGDAALTASADLRALAGLDAQALARMIAASL